MLYACNIYCLSHKLKFLYSGTARASPDSGLFGSLGGATASRGQLRFRRRRNPWHHRPELRERFLIFFTLCPFLDSLYTRTIRLLIISVSTRSCVNKNFNNILLKLVLQTKNYVAIQKKKNPCSVRIPLRVEQQDPKCFWVRNWFDHVEWRGTK